MDEIKPNIRVSIPRLQLNTTYHLRWTARRDGSRFEDEEASVVEVPVWIGGSRRWRTMDESRSEDWSAIVLGALTVAARFPLGICAAMTLFL